MKGIRIIPTSVHAVLDYIVGIALIAAPWIFGFADVAAAKWAAIAIGAASIGMALLTNHELGLVHVIPMHVHLGVDAAAGLFLALSPWILGFADEGANVWVPHLIVGITLLAVVAMSNPWPDRRELAQREEEMFRHTARA